MPQTTPLSVEAEDGTTDESPTLDEIIDRHARPAQRDASDAPEN